MYFAIAAEYFNRLKTLAKFHWQKVKKVWQSSKGLNSAFYFFDLQQGCKLIALFEALVSLVRICWIYYLVYRSDTKSLFPEPQWVYYWLKGRKNNMCYHHTNYHFHVGLNLVTILNSMLLLVGIKWAIVALLYYWMHITMLTASMTHVNNVFNNFTFTQVYFMIPSLTLQYYFFLVIVSLIWKIGEMNKSNSVEMKKATVEIEE